MLAVQRYFNNEYIVHIYKRGWNSNNIQITSHDTKEMLLLLIYNVVKKILKNQEETNKATPACTIATTFK